MRYGTATIMAAILMALIAAAPLTAGAADTADKAKEKAQTTTQEAKTMVTDSWVTSKTKISLFADERVKGTQVSVDTTKGSSTSAARSTPPRPRAPPATSRRGSRA
jgi:osmotically-inducible protein OsmY